MKSYSLNKIATGAKAMLLVTVLILAVNGSFAQQIKITNIGIRAGANMANWHYNNSSSDDLTLKMRTNFDAAVFTDIRLPGNFSLQPELGISSYGSKVSDEIEQIEYKLKYLTVPVLVKYRLPAGIAVFAGPQVGILLSSKGELEGHESDVKNMFGKTDIMVTGGVEYNFSNGLSVGARYNRGFVNMYKKGNNVKLNNYSFGLNIAYKLDFNALPFKMRG